MKKTILLFALIIGSLYPAFSQRVLKDIAQGTDNAYVFQGGSFSSGDTLFFRANDTKDGNYAYYITNGQSGSIKKISTNEFNHRNFSNPPTSYKFKNSNYLYLQGNLYQIKNDSTYLVKYVYYGYEFNFLGFFQLNNQLYFLIHDRNGNALDYWKTDGTEAGTSLQKKIIMPDRIQYPGQGFYLNNKYYHSFYDGSINFFVTDGTISGTTTFKNNRVSMYGYEVVNNDMYFQRSDAGDYRIKLWKSKGDSLSTQKVVSEIDGDTNYSVHIPFKFANELYFISFSNGQIRISKFNSTTSEVNHVTNTLINLQNYILINAQKFYYADISPDYNSINFYENNGSLESNTFRFSIPQNYNDLFNYYSSGNKLYICQQKRIAVNNVNEFAGDAIYWVFDGNTVKKISDLAPGLAFGSYNNAVGVVNDIFYFSASDGQHGYELWRTDGTAAGTFMVKDINTQIASSNPRLMFGLGDYVYFTADDISHGNEVWRTNGSTTSLYAEFDGSNTNSHVLDTEFHNKAKFKNNYIANLSNKFVEFTPTGTLKLLSALPIRSSSTQVEFNDSLYFCGSDGNLWKSDATFLNPKLAVYLDSLNNGTGNYGVFGITKVDTMLFFISNDFSTLWKTNGKKSGTVKLFQAQPDQLPGTSLNSGIKIWPMQKKILFEKYNYGEPGNAYELWVSDGTTNGTKKLLTPLGYNSLGVYNDKLYFINNGTLWCSNGTSAGTQHIDNRNFAAGKQLKDKFYLTINTGSGIDYYELDKNNQIKHLITIDNVVNDFPYGTGKFFNIDDRYLLTHVSTPTHLHFYITDGNKENFKKVLVLKSTTVSEDEDKFLYHNKKIYFSATDTLKGQELWIWDFECPDGYTIRDAITKDSTIIYGKNIWGQSSISNNKTVTYDAKNGITLQPGFEAPKGAVFKTKLVGCANNTSNTIEDNNLNTNEPLVKINTATTYPQLMDFLYYFPNKALKEIYERAQQNKSLPISWEIVTEKDIYRLDLKIGTSVLKGWLPKKN
ncbi:ELWxxDGT repeat protein [Emticicia agri]|uniref:DUF5050 domain-containing protein n=1 Tax=Emticicia agri TaxID=2492393 RepID=A0A4Q5LYS0_9BACT|nr:ELWxxDGT repeat protein [Emticicia agri]RYU95086.1 hypothetical protein EWM59_13630 [Emticicia agri]